MTVVRTAVCALIALLVNGSVFGFAAGDGAAHMWDKQHRHARGPSLDSSRGASKTIPGVTVRPSPPIVIALFGPRAIESSRMTRSAALRPPFVPPRA
jgi:hypothetical protein